MTLKIVGGFGWTKKKKINEKQTDLKFKNELVGNSTKCLLLLW